MATEIPGEFCYWSSSPPYQTIALFFWTPIGLNMDQRHSALKICGLDINPFSKTWKLDGMRMSQKMVSAENTKQTQESKKKKNWRIITSRHLAMFYWKRKNSSIFFKTLTGHFVLGLLLEWNRFISSSLLPWFFRNLPLNWWVQTPRQNGRLSWIIDFRSTLSASLNAYLESNQDTLEW